MNEIKITETVYKQSGCSSWNTKHKQTKTGPSPPPPPKCTVCMCVGGGNLVPRAFPLKGKSPGDEVAPPTHIQTVHLTFSKTQR